MSAREQVEWTIYAASRPFGEEQADRRAALIAHTVAATFAGKQAPKIEKFLAMLRPESPKPEQSVEDLRSRMIGLANRRKGGKPKQEPNGDDR